MKEKGFGMNILVTGGHGMLGSAIDFGLKPSRKELDLFDYDALHDYIVINGVNEIIHCAGAVGGVKANDDFMYDYFMNNIRMNTISGSQHSFCLLAYFHTMLLFH
jgi:dTDP-4-dehydrorhamnose reductase